MWEKWVLRAMGGWATENNWELLQRAKSGVRPRTAAPVFIRPYPYASQKKTVHQYLLDIKEESYSDDINICTALFNPVFSVTDVNYCLFFYDRGEGWAGGGSAVLIICFIYLCLQEGAVLCFYCFYF